MSESLGRVKRGDYQEVLFWLLLLGSWQFLASAQGNTGIIGAFGTTAFLIYAWAKLDRLEGLGLDNAHWRSAGRTSWLIAAGSGIVAGVVIFVTAAASGQIIRLGDNWKLTVLQVTLGPVLEEIVFRGYLYAFLARVLARFTVGARCNRLVIVLAALVFAACHLGQPSVCWPQLACITCTGTLYGWIRWRSGSTAPAAVSHASYNLTLYAISGAVLLGEKVLPAR